MNRIKELREKACFTQAELAEYLGVKRVTVAQWERGENKPRVDTLIKLSKLFKVTTDDLLRL
jgi:transcriptional regulator with XRE-family HTH domain|uniref:helix-turn-helix transcriptional regulator n=1 Tax=Megasphaera elsdenii TaxID=907 RepID=UPI002067B4B7|nr:MAG TPA: helix-turn-helix domain protein [Caudoviricetes sp.]